MRILPVAILLLASGCLYHHSDEVVPTCSADHPVSFDAEVSPVMQTDCDLSGCHNGSNPLLPTLVTYQQVRDNSQDMLFQLTNGAMPPAGSSPLSPVALATLECWINQGASTR